jgi:hypothetical protein
MNIFHSVECNGKMMLVNAMAGGARTEKPQGHEDPWKDFVYSSRLTIDTLAKESKNHTGPHWWERGEYGWAFPRLFYNSTINGKNYDYVLTNEWGFARDLKSGQAIDMSDVTYAGWATAPYPYLPSHEYSMSADVRDASLPEPIIIPLRNIGTGTLPAITASCDFAWVDASVSRSGDDQRLTIALNTIPPSKDYTVPITVNAGEFTPEIELSVRIDDERRAAIIALDTNYMVVDAGRASKIGYTLLDQFREPFDGPAEIEWLPGETGTIHAGDSTLIGANTIGFNTLEVQIAGRADLKSTMLVHNRIAIDDLDTASGLDHRVTFSGKWNEHDEKCAYGNCAYRDTVREAENYSSQDPSTGATAEWKPMFAQAGEYEVWIAHKSLGNGKTLTLDVTHKNGTDKVVLDENTEKITKNWQGGSRYPWYKVGKYQFDAGAGALVKLSYEDEANRESRLYVDAVWFDIPRDQWISPDDMPVGQRISSNVLPVGAKAKLMRVDIYDARGRLVAQASAQHWIDMRRQLPPGLYVLRRRYHDGIIENMKALIKR